MIETTKLGSSILVGTCSFAIRKFSAAILDYFHLNLTIVIHFCIQNGEKRSASPVLNFFGSKFFVLSKKI